MSHHVGPDLCYWIVTDSGQVISKTSVEHVTCEDYLSEVLRQRLRALKRNLENVLTIVTLSDRVKMALI
jgi:hypothetical protein